MSITSNVQGNQRDNSEPSTEAKRNDEEGVTEVPDYKDQYGRCWPFLCHARDDDDEDRRRICRENWLIDNGGWSARQKGTCKYYQCRQNGWHFQRRVTPAPPRCPARAVFVIETGNFYMSKDGHNHSLEKVKMTLPRMDTDDYIDQQGKSWKFFTRIETVSTTTMKEDINEEAYEFCRQRHLFQTGTGQNKNANHFRCGQPKCKFRALFLRRNCCLYARGEHDHQLKPLRMEKRKIAVKSITAKIILGKKRKEPKKMPRNPKSGPMPPPNVGDDYVDRLQRRWHFYGKLKSENRNEFRSTLRKFLLSKFNEIQSDEFGARKEFFKCKTKAKWGNQQGQACQFSAVFLHANSCLYSRNEHKHDELKGANSGSRMGEDLEEEEKDEELEIVENQPITPELDLEYVDSVNHDNKWMPQMKREGEMQRPTEWPTINIEDPMADMNLRFYNHNQKLLRIKKEEQIEENDEEAIAPAPSNANNDNEQMRFAQQPTTSSAAAAAATAAGPTRMLLRERKRRVNYAE